MDISFIEKKVNSLSFGQMTMTGYKKVVELDHDDTEHGWKTGDLIVYSIADVPVMRMQFLISGITYSQDGDGQMETFLMNGQN